MLMCQQVNSMAYRPISVNSQSGGQNNKIILHLKGLFLSGEKTTIVCPPDWELLKWVYWKVVNNKGCHPVDNKITRTFV